MSDLSDSQDKRKRPSLVTTLSTMDLSGPRSPGSFAKSPKSSKEELMAARRKSVDSRFAFDAGIFESGITPSKSLHRSSSADELLSITEETLSDKLSVAKEIVDSDLRNFIAQCNAMLDMDDDNDPGFIEITQKTRKLAEDTLAVPSHAITVESWKAILDNVHSMQENWDIEWEKQNVVTKLLFIVSRISRLFAAEEEEEAEEETESELGPSESMSEIDFAEGEEVVSPTAAKKVAFNKGTKMVQKLLTGLSDSFRKKKPGEPPSPRGSPTASPSMPRKLVMCRICELYVGGDLLGEHSDFCAQLTQEDMKAKEADKKLHECSRKITLQMTQDIPEELLPILETMKTVANTVKDMAHETKSVEVMGQLSEQLDAVCSNVPGNDQRVNKLANTVKYLQDQKLAAMAQYLKIGEQMKALNIVSVPKDSGSVDGDDGTSRIRRPSSGSSRTGLRDFKILKPISRGAFGRVYLGQKIKTEDFYAIKVLKKSDMQLKNKTDQVKAEKNILHQMSNAYVVRLYYTFQSKENLYMVMEYLNGGDLASLLVAMDIFEEPMAKLYAAEIVCALQYLHKGGIVHRDLKPDNVLIDKEGHLKLTDFGLSRSGLLDRRTLPSNFDPFQVQENKKNPMLDSLIMTGNHLQDGADVDAMGNPTPKASRRFSLVGTPDYLAPEILLGTGHGVAADWWSLGVILFEFLTGIPPFNDDSPEAIFDNILNRIIPWPDIPDEMSEEAADLVDKLLTLDPKKRLGANGAEEVRAHPFFEGVNWDELRKQPGPFVPQITDATDVSYFEDGTGRSGFGGEDVFLDETMTTSMLATTMAANERNQFLDFTYKNISNLKAMNNQIAEKMQFDTDGNGL
eukprot:GFYU01003958.1.p1 GENE.GFYU01003958.1~~GFYU01003958.1.p1  ORF type:complete len:854 (-),score=245.74 GFYU01003958.1:112-2673(-)